MKIALLLGHEGPVKAWIDGVEVLVTSAGKVPAQPGTSMSKTRQLDVGEHGILVALNTNGGRGCGIHLELARLDLDKNAILAGAGAYSFPKVLG